MAREPDERLAAKVLAAPLYDALTHIFDQGIADCMLVGGTALAGYYAGHRRSDDLDLFVRDVSAFRAAILAVGSLETLSPEITLSARQHTSQFFDALCVMGGHTFTVQVVLDQGAFVAGKALRAHDGVCVADLRTLLKQKAATLVSRCAEKDLYDLQWLFGEFQEIGVKDLVELGAEMDGGMTAETALISLVGSRIRPEGCDFSLTEDDGAVFRRISEFKKTLARAFDKLARKQTVGPLGELVRKLK